VHGLPGVEPAVIDTPVQIIDVFASVVEWAETSAAARPSARALPTAESGERRVVFAEYGEAEYAIKLIPVVDWVTYAIMIADARRFCRDEDRIRGNRMAVIDFPWKLIWHEDGGRLLFDVREDPEETTDRAGTHPQIAARLAEEAARIRTSVAPRGGASPATVEKERAEPLRALGYIVGDQ
jgi:hypothetical protein